MIISIALGAFTILLFVFIIARFIQSKNKMLSVFLRINESEIREHLMLVEHWCKLLDKNTSGSNLEALALLDPFTQQQQPLHVKDLQAFRKKPRNKGNSNGKLIYLIIISLLLTSALIIGYVIAIPLLNTQTIETLKKIDLILNCDQNYYQSFLLLYEIHVYIAQGSNRRVRGIPLSQEFDRLFVSYTKLFGEFIKLTTEITDYINDPIISQILTGNLCTIFPTRYKIGDEYCPIGLNKLIPNGLIQVTNYILSSFRETQISFEKSAKGPGNQMAALNIFFFMEVEPMAADYWFPPFAKMSDLIRDQFIHESTALSHPSGKFILAWGVIFIVFGIAGWWIIRVAFERHRVAWKKMVRQIPISIVNTNKMLKSYLTATSGTRIN